MKRRLIIPMMILSCMTVLAYGQHQNNYRVSKKVRYLIVQESPDITLYKRNMMVAPKDENSPRVKYYFSTPGDSTLRDLNLYNIKSAFPGDNRLHNQVDALFRSDDELHRYDNFHHMYSIAWILKTERSRN
ncbi:hypothetical protein [Chitinophaga vietnamensis]|uniref:hypothetical protein n=1 Tax=Chitinophaga vietnamensis TaxID=2593957 RepID=UPI00117858E9|nr:hypothetical protein [Chitinophaga vietnamensis]